MNSKGVILVEDIEEWLWWIPVFKKFLYIVFQVPEYSKNFEESEICENAFSLIIAFDEIVALGYRENVNLAQIRTFVEMDSHEEKVYRAVLEV